MSTLDDVQTRHKVVACGDLQTNWHAALVSGDAEGLASMTTAERRGGAAKAPPVASSAAIIHSPDIRVSFGVGASGCSRVIGTTSRSHVPKPLAVHGDGRKICPQKLGPGKGRKAQNRLGTARGETTSGRELPAEWLQRLWSGSAGEQSFTERVGNSRVRGGHLGLYTRFSKPAPDSS